MNRLRYLLPVFLLLMMTHARSQDKEVSYYLFDGDWKSVSVVKKASYLAMVRSLRDTAERWEYYHVKGPLIKVETIKKDSADMANGWFCWYGKDGRIDSTGYYANGFEDSSWSYYNDTCGLD